MPLTGTRLFVFGLGYSASRFIARHGGEFSGITGTVRSADKQRVLQQARVEALLFGADAADPGIASHLAETDWLLVSVPPGPGGDPVLQAFGAQIAASNISRIVYLSTIGVYGDRDGAWIDETATTEGEGRRRQRIAAEAAWRALPGNRTSLLRLAGIYGPGRNALLNLRAGSAHRIVKPGHVSNRIHVDDIAQAIAAAFASADTGVWNVCDDEPVPPQDVVTYAAGLMGIAPPPEQDFATSEMSPMARSFYATSNRVSNTRMKRELKVVLNYPTYRAGLTALWQAGEGR